MTSECKSGQSPQKFENPWDVTANNFGAQPESRTDDDPYKETREALLAQLKTSFKSYQRLGGIHPEEHVMERARVYIDGLSDDNLDWVEGEIDQGSIVDLITRKEGMHLSFHPVEEVKQYAHAAVEYTKGAMRELAATLFEPMKSMADKEHDRTVVSDDIYKVYSSATIRGDMPQDILGSDRYEGRNHELYPYDSSAVTFMLVSRLSSRINGKGFTFTPEELAVITKESDADITSMAPYEHFEHLMKIAVEAEEASADRSVEEKRQAVKDAIFGENSGDGNRSNVAWNYQMYPVNATEGQPGYYKWSIGDDRGAKYVLSSGVELFESSARDNSDSGGADGRVFIEFVDIHSQQPTFMPDAIKDK